LSRGMVFLAVGSAQAPARIPRARGDAVQLKVGL
jgi:hypothetical protein